MLFLTQQFSIIYIFLLGCGAKKSKVFCLLTLRSYCKGRSTGGRLWFTGEFSSGFVFIILFYFCCTRGSKKNECVSKGRKQYVTTVINPPSPVAINVSYAATLKRTVFFSRTLKMSAARELFVPVSTATPPALIINFSHCDFNHAFMPETKSTSAQIFKAVILIMTRKLVIGWAEFSARTVAVNSHDCVARGVS